MKRPFAWVRKSIQYKNHVGSCVHVATNETSLQCIYDLSSNTVPPKIAMGSNLSLLLTWIIIIVNSSNRWCRVHVNKRCILLGNDSKRELLLCSQWELQQNESRKQTIVVQTGQYFLTTTVHTTHFQNLTHSLKLPELKFLNNALFLYHYVMRMLKYKS